MIKRKIFQFLLVFMIPTSIMFGSYIYFDPFKIIWQNKSQFESEVPLNRDFVSTELFIQHYKSQQYNSFVFGSSRTISVMAEDWMKYIPKDSKVFKYDAAGENIYGIYCKLRYLNSINDIAIDNCLIFICRDAFHKEMNSSKHLNIKHPLISQESWIQFHFTHIKVYFTFKFLLGFFYYKITGKINSLNEDIIQINKTHLDISNNQIYVDGFENELSKGEDEYYKKNNNLFHIEEESLDKKAKRIEKEGFSSETIYMLKEIKKILINHHTNYKIILSPTFDKIPFNKSALGTLNEIFPPDRIFNFTGTNWITENKYYWYENYHFRPFIGDSILKKVYEK